MLTDVPDFRVGHATDLEAMTGCTVILCPPETVGSCMISGHAPGSRETALLAPEKSVNEVHAVLLTGGSAFGLAAADGVVAYLEERGIGYATPWGPIPLVPGAVIFDLYLGNPRIRPDREMGYRACENASGGAIELGCVGAGTGATVGKWAGLEHVTKGGVGSASVENGDLVVGALAVVNAVGDVLARDGSVLAGAYDSAKGFLGDGVELRALPAAAPTQGMNTTLVAVATNARLSKLDARRVTTMANDGLARAIQPAHTSHEGDAVFVLASGPVTSGVDVVGEMAAVATTEAIRSGVREAVSLGGVRAVGDRE